mmetsp:Transcript_97159/g.299459  ORF Transcript_97159/g.299459 Transcript_97159/m.299459 type:complete len:240 (-) Transcript_97159:588-1307(-)
MVPGGQGQRWRRRLRRRRHPGPQRQPRLRRARWPARTDRRQSCHERLHPAGGSRTRPWGHGHSRALWLAACSLSQARQWFLLRQPGTCLFCNTSTSNRQWAVALRGEHSAPGAAHACLQRAVAGHRQRAMALSGGRPAHGSLPACWAASASGPRCGGPAAGARGTRRQQQCCLRAWGCGRRGALAHGQRHGGRYRLRGRRAAPVQHEPTGGLTRKGPPAPRLRRPLRVLCGRSHAETPC